MLEILNQRNYRWLVVYLPIWKIWVRQLGWLFPIYEKIKHVPNHQPDQLSVSFVIWSCHVCFYMKIWKYHPNITQNNLIERASFLSFPYLAQQLNSPHHPIRYNPWGTGAVRRLVASVCHCNSKFQSHVVLPLLNVACGQHSNGHLTCKVWYHLRSYYITKWYDTSRMINRMIDNMRMRKGFSHSFEPVSGVIQHPTLWVPICTPCRLCCDHMPIIGMIFPWLSPYVPLSKKLLHWFLHSHETTNRH